MERIFTTFGEVFSVCTYHIRELLEALCMRLLKSDGVSFSIVIVTNKRLRRR